MAQHALEILYIAVCIAALTAAVDLQMRRHQQSKACVWWAYTALAAGLTWELIDALCFGAPDFPSTRWLLLPALAVAQGAAALKDRGWWNPVKKGTS